MWLLHIKFKGKKYRPKRRSKNFDLVYTPDLCVGLKGQILKLHTQISIFIIELSTKIVDRLLSMICTISKLNLWVGKMGLTRYDLNVSLK